MRAMEQSSPEPSSVFPRAAEHNKAPASTSCQPLLPDGASLRAVIPQNREQETQGNVSSQRICGGPCPAKQPGHQSKEASEGHAPAPL